MHKHPSNHKQFVTKLNLKKDEKVETKLAKSILKNFRQLKESRLQCLSRKRLRF